MDQQDKIDEAVDVINAKLEVELAYGKQLNAASAILAKSSEQIQSDFEQILDRIALNTGTDIRTFWYLNIGPDSNKVLMEQFLRFYERGYNQARIDLARELLL